MNLHATHPAAWDPACGVCRAVCPTRPSAPARPRAASTLVKTLYEFPVETHTWNLALHTTPPREPAPPKRPSPPPPPLPPRNETRTPLGTDWWTARPAPMWDPMSICPPNPDPLRPVETDQEPSCCELACYEDPGCTCDGCWVRHHDDPDRGVWIGAVLLLAALLVGIVIGRLS